jgi:hypothetical protein
MWVLGDTEIYFSQVTRLVANIFFRDFLLVNAMDYMVVKRSTPAYGGVPGVSNNNSSGRISGCKAKAHTALAGDPRPQQRRSPITIATTSASTPITIPRIAPEPNPVFPHVCPSSPTEMKSSTLTSEFVWSLHTVVVVDLCWCRQCSTTAAIEYLAR